MKSPWRFLADLTSRRKPKPASAPIALPAPTPPVEDETRDPANAAYAPVATSVVDSKEPVKTVEELAELPSPTVPEPEAAIEVSDALQSSSAELIEDEVKLPDPAAESEPPANAEIEPEPSGEHVAAGSAPQEAGVAPAKRVERGQQRSRSSLPAVALDEPVAPKTDAQPLSFFDEASALDGEIAALRLALAQKLKEQNAQLRTMLARYETR